MSDPSPEGLDFEAALERLGTLVDRLERGELALEDSLEAFEAGMALARHCREQLDAAELRVSVVEEAAGGMTERPLPEEPE